MLTTVLIACLACILGLFYWCYAQKQKYKSLHFIPGPPPLPIIGNVFDVGTNTVDHLKYLLELKKKYGNIYRLWIGPKNILLIVSDPELIEFFLSNPKHNYKDYLYNLFIDWLGKGLLTSNGTYWQRHRKLITPAFHFKILEQFLPIFHSNGNVLINNLSKKSVANKNGFDIYYPLSMFTLDVICETSMGTSVHAQDNPDNEYVKAVEFLRITLIERIFSPWKQNNFIFRFASCYPKFQKALNTVHAFVRDVIEKRREFLLKEINTNNPKNEVDDCGVKKRTALLDILLKSAIDGQPLSNEEIHEEVQTFMFAGHDTTSTAGFFILYALAKHPEIQQKVVEELVPIFDENSQKEFTFKEFQEMKYTERVIKESLRYYPPAPFFSRTVENDVEYKDHIIPKGTVLILLAIGIHRDPKYFTNPEEFKPDRFLSEKPNSENYFSYIPFSAGPRNCIGQKFAMLELKSFISKIVYNFEITLAKPEKPMILASGGILGTADTHLFKLKKRIL